MNKIKEKKDPENVKLKYPNVNKVMFAIIIKQFVKKIDLVFSYSI